MSDALTLTDGLAARAGICHANNPGDVGQRPYPRTRGDMPPDTQRSQQREHIAPHARGYASRIRSSSSSSTHRPARSGMRPSWKSGCGLPPKLPRSHRDSPELSMASGDFGSTAPLARGYAGD